MTPKKYTLSITQRCNLACDYCYIQKNNTVMNISTAKKIINFIYENAQINEIIDVGFFGGEPFLEFNLLKEITDLIQTHKSFDLNRVIISVTTNGTIFSQEILDFLIERKIVLCISCDGPSIVHDASRHFPDGSGSSIIVEKNIVQALNTFPRLPINTVYSPENLHLLPEVVDYLSSLGIRTIYLSPNISAQWTKREAEMFPYIYDKIGNKYMDYYREGKPRYISLIDSKIAVILRGGYKSLEKCRVGTGEFAFAPSGNIYLCERLIGSDNGKAHCIGNINEGLIPKVNFTTELNVSNVTVNAECQICGLKNYCMNWCGCTNYSSTGCYNTVAPYICASEKASINTAFRLIQKMGDDCLNFSDHLAGNPIINSYLAKKV
jgi:uncharacterized protein